MFLPSCDPLKSNCSGSESGAEGDIALAENARIWAGIDMMMLQCARHFGFLLLGLLLALSSCRDKPRFDWEMEVAPPAGDAAADAGQVDTPRPGEGTAERLRFISHNVENWLSMRRTVDGTVHESASKPEDEKQALIAMIARHQPEVFGLSEIGTPEDLQDVRARLRAAGVDLPHAHHHQGKDPVRALGLLSKYPITSTSNEAEVSFRLAGRQFEMLRGILDATVTTPDGRDFRFLGVHLKSKREVSHYDQAQFRIQEAHRLRAHIDAILQKDPAARLVVFGDLNDTRRSQAVTTVAGAYGSGRQLLPVPARDSRRQMWTHHWRFQDVYSRIDYIFITSPLREEADFDHARVLDDPEWRKASDHRPLLLDFLPAG